METHSGSGARPFIFISYAQPDASFAVRLDDTLGKHGISSFLALRDAGPGGARLAALSLGLHQSDYYVWLISHGSIADPRVEMEWTAALSRELNERRVFLFLFRLDPTPVPMILTARECFDGFQNWNEAVSHLVAAWEHDWRTRRNGVSVFPVPTVVAPKQAVEAGAVDASVMEQGVGCDATERDYLVYLRKLLCASFSDEELRTLCFDLGLDYDDLPTQGRANKARELVSELYRHKRIPGLVSVASTLHPERDWLDPRNIDVNRLPRFYDAPLAGSIGIFVYNQDLGVEHFIRVASSLTGKRLFERVRAALALEEKVTTPEGRFGLCFSYALLHHNVPIPDDTSLQAIGITDDACLNLQVSVQPFGPRRTFESAEYRSLSGDEALPPTIARQLITKAFGHLLP